MTHVERKIRVNRAPVLTLWAATVAERMGFDRAAALTLGQAVAGMSAYAKGVSLGLIEPRPELVHAESERPGSGESPRVDLLGRAVPVVRTAEGLRALAKGRPGDPARIERYLAAKFRHGLADARAAMGELAAAFPPEELHRQGFRLYERFRPGVPAGEAGWGAAGELDLAAVLALKPARDDPDQAELAL